LAYTRRPIFVSASAHNILKTKNPFFITSKKCN
jgi:hypothetical protein